jgi:hypothetical protein
MSPRPVELHIDELALSGVAPHEREAVVTAFRAELSRALRAGAARPPAAPAARVEIDPVHGHAAELGAAAARALAKGLSG